jgi:hypothetical protein
MKSIPFVTIGNDEIAELPSLGKTIRCWRCGKRHSVKYGTTQLADGTVVPSTTLAFMTCRTKSYLCGIAGKEWRP